MWMLSSVNKKSPNFNPMPVTTRSSHLQTPEGPLALIPHSDPSAPSKASNATDPITLENITDIPPGVIFLHHPRVASRKKLVHAYDARALARFLQESGTNVAPLSRQPFTSQELMDISQRASPANSKFTLTAAMLFHAQCRRMPANVTRWQQLDWLCGMLQTHLDGLHGVDLDRHEVAMHYTLITAMVVPSIERDVHILVRHAQGRETVRMLLCHHGEVIGRHSRCATLDTFTPCAELAQVVVGAFERIRAGTAEPVSASQ